MAGYSGIGSNGVGFLEESPWGTAILTNPTHSLDARGGMESVIGECDQTVAQDLSNFGSINTDTIKGNKRVSGSIDYDLRYGGGWMMFMGHLLGQAAPAEAPTDNYVMPLGADPNATQMAKGITLRINRDGTTGGAFDYLYSGCRPVSMDFNFTENSIATCSVGLIGKDLSEVRAASSGGTYTRSTKPYVKSPSDRTSPTSFIQWDGGGHICKNASISIAVPWELNLDIQSPLGLVPVLAGPMEITGSFEVVTPNSAASPVGNVWVDDYRSQNGRPLIYTMDGAAGFGLVFSLTKALITSAPDPHASGPELQTTTVEWKALAQASENQGTFTLVTDEGAAW